MQKKSSKINSISKEELCSFLVRYHFLDNYDRLSGKEGIKKLLRRIGSVQYDPLDVVGRNPDLVLQSRVNGYKTFFLEELLYKDRSLIDAWDKEMSIYLTQELPFFSRVQKQREESSRRVLEHRGQKETLLYLTQTIDEIKKRGPLAAREIKMGACQTGRWGHRQVSGAALDHLFSAGKLGIHSKRNAQKVYDLMENLIPKKILEAKDPFENDDDFFEWYFLRRIGSMGAHWLRSGSGWLGYFLGDTKLRQDFFGRLEEKKLIVPVKVPDINETFYIRRKDLSLLNETSRYDGAARFMAPLDNMLWDRLMVKKIFGFEYTWEVYVPEVKRKYGYYVLPVLYENRLIARFEPVKYEPGRPFKIKNWWWEPFYLKQKPGSKIRDSVVRGLENFAEYLRADGVEMNSFLHPHP